MLLIKIKNLSKADINSGADSRQFRVETATDNNAFISVGVDYSTQTATGYYGVIQATRNAIQENVLSLNRWEVESW